MFVSFEGCAAGALQQRRAFEHLEQPISARATQRAKDVRRLRLVVKNHEKIERLPQPTRRLSLKQAVGAVLELAVLVAESAVGADEHVLGRLVTLELPVPPRDADESAALASGGADARLLLRRSRVMHAFDVLGDPVRRRILELLAESERSSGEIVEVVQREYGISQPAVSQHLRTLRESGFATVRVDGARRIYAVDAAPLKEVDAWVSRFRGFWEHKLDALATEVARGKRGRRRAPTAR